MPANRMSRLKVADITEDALNLQTNVKVIVLILKKLVAVLSSVALIISFNSDTLTL